MTRRHGRRDFLGTAGALSLPLCAALAGRGSAADAYTLRLDLPNPAASFEGVSAIRFAAAVERRSKGQMKIEVYPNGQIAKEQETVSGLQSGVLDLAIQGTQVLIPLFPRYQVFDMPFLFKDDAAAYRVLEGPIGNEFFAELESKGIVGLAWGTEGFKELGTTTKAVIVPEDMKGLRIRIPSAAVPVATFEALGAIPVVIDPSETLVALTQRTVDGMANALDTIVSGKFYTALKHIAMFNHVFSINPLMGSKRKLDALPPPLQRILKEEAKAIQPFWRALMVQQTASAIGFLKKDGLAFTEIQYPAFRRAMDPVYAMFQPKLGGDLLARVSRAAQKGN